MIDVCCVYLDYFVNSVLNFIKCLIEQLRLFRFCEECVIFYVRVKSIYEDIEKVIIKVK